MTSPDLLTLCQRKVDMSNLETIIREELWKKETLEISTRLIKNVLYVDGFKHNLLSISQLCDKGFKIEFNKNCSVISEAMSGEVVHIGKRIGNIYMLNIEQASFHELSCLVRKIDDSWLRHHRDAHINMHHLNHLVRKDLVIGIPKLKFEKK